MAIRFNDIEQNNADIVAVANELAEDIQTLYSIQMAFEENEVGNPETTDNIKKVGQYFNDEFIPQHEAAVKAFERIKESDSDITKREQEDISATKAEETVKANEYTGPGSKPALF